MLSIGLLGNMNNMSYQIAKYLRRLDVNVTLFVDAPRGYQLDRPESWDPELEVGYPSWIVDLCRDRLPSGLDFILPLRWASLIRRLNRFDGVVLNGNWISLGSYLDPKVVVANFFAGADLDYCGPSYPRRLAEERNPRWAARQVAQLYYELLWGLQRRGIRRAELVNYYLPGVNPDSDDLLARVKDGQKYRQLALRGIDCEHFPFSEPSTSKETFDVLSVVRFFFTKDRVENKRNDVMIEGLGKFVRRVQPKNLRITFFEKGDDVEEAKRLCDINGISRYVRWLRETGSNDLLQYYREADVAFDQLGSQWLGAGLFSMCIGRPLIANARLDLYRASLGVEPPVCNAVNSEEVASWLVRLYLDRELRIRLGAQCSQFVNKYYDMSKTAEFVANGVIEFRRHWPDGRARPSDA